MTPFDILTIADLQEKCKPMSSHIGRRIIPKMQLKSPTCRQKQLRDGVFVLEFQVCHRVLQHLGDNKNAVRYLSEIQYMFSAADVAISFAL